VRPRARAAASRRAQQRRCAADRRLGASPGRRSLRLASRFQSHRTPHRSETSHLETRHHVLPYSCHTRAAPRLQSQLRHEHRGLSFCESFLRARPLSREKGRGGICAKLLQKLLPLLLFRASPSALGACVGQLMRSQVGHAEIDPVAGSAGCDPSHSRPRIHTYRIPHHILPPPTVWRNVRALKNWMEASKYHEPDPFCADYFLIPSHPVTREKDGTDVGDVRMMQVFDYIRMHWPFWNETLRHGHARHLMMLPCDHGPGDCAFSRPIVANKYASGRASVGSFLPGSAELTQYWRYAWEAINPASPSRLLIFLTCARCLVLRVCDISVLTSDLALMRRFH
jgi:hypothetical protein